MHRAWVPLSLLCLCGWAGVLGGALVLYLLLRAHRREVSEEPIRGPDTEGAEAGLAEEEVEVEPDEATLMTQPLAPEVEAPPVSVPPVQARSRPATKPFTTYQNPSATQVTIHRTGCLRIHTRDGQQRYPQGKYAAHTSYAAAAKHARSTGQPVVDCKVCHPEAKEAKRPAP